MTEFGAFLLPLVPLLVLVAFLLAGRYPGCEAMVRLAERLSAHSRLHLRAPRRLLLPGPPERSFAQGGLLLAHALSGRAPPV